MDLNPARCACDSLPPVLSTPSFYKAHSYGTHARQLVHRLKPLVNRLSQQRRKLLVVENFQIASGGYFTDSCWVPAVTLVAVWALNKHRAVTQTFSEDLTSDVIQPYPTTDMSARHLHLLRPVDIGEQTEAEALRVGGVGEPVDGEGGLRRVERLSHPRVQLVV